VRGSASIERLAATYVVPATHPEPMEVRSRLDAVGRRLPEALGTPFAELGEGRDGEVWLLRHLDVDVELDLTADDLSLARAWADAITTAVAARLASPAHGVQDAESVAYRDRGEQLAAFLSDLVAGTAWSRWSYRVFDGLRVLPVPAAVEAALGRDRETGRAALALLAHEHRLEPVLAAVGEAGCARLLGTLYPDVQVRAEARARAGATTDGLGEEPLEPAIELLRRHAGAAPARGARSTPAEEQATARVSPGAAGVSTEAAPGREAPTPAQGPGGGRAAWDEPVTTPFGGAFLLLRSLVELGFARLDPEARLLLLRAALGAERAAATVRDGVLALAAGLEHGDEPAASDRATLLLRGLLATHRTDGRAVAIDSTQLGLLVRDAESGAWLAAGGATDVQRAIDVLTDASDDAPAIVEGEPPPVDELAYFALDGAPPFAALAGRALVHDLTARLIGFERSTPAHVFDNLLDREASVVPSRNGIRVDLSPAPLDVVLLLAGFDGLRVEVPWLGEVELAFAR